VFNGFDTTANCGKLASKIKAAGYDFVGRYYAHRGSKRLTVQEAKLLSAAGVKIVAVWEDAPTRLNYFSHARGVVDGTSAYHCAMLTGQPAGTPIYFTVDFDAPVQALSGAITDYFQGIVDGFDVIANRQSPIYQIGAYGSGATCAALLKYRLASYAWLAQSEDWAGHAQFLTWNIKQGAEKRILGLAADVDQATKDYGGFTI
jgi:hypothetical protein